MTRPQVSDPESANSTVVRRSLGVDKVLVGSIVILVGVFSVPLLQLFRFASQSDLYSHILLIPLVTLYFIWIGRNDVRPASEPNRLLGTLLLATAALVLVGSWYFTRRQAGLAVEDQVSGNVLGFVLLIIGVSSLRLGRRTLYSLSFPLGFLLFMVPFPTAVRDGIETFFQHTSSWAAASFFTIAQTPFFRDNTFFQLPGINLEVAPECSGIRSSLALFITSIVAGQLFLKSTRRRLILALAVIPLGILRNGLRVFTIGELCVHIGPEMIDSPIHHRGGPLFFALSLIPFGILLYLLIRSDRRSSTHKDVTPTEVLPPAVDTLPSR